MVSSLISFKLPCHVFDRRLDFGVGWRNHQFHAQGFDTVLEQVAVVFMRRTVDEFME